MKYFTKKEILENFKAILEEMDESKLDINTIDSNNPNAVSGIYAHQFSYDHNYINDEEEAESLHLTDAVSWFRKIEEVR